MAGRGGMPGSYCTYHSLIPWLFPQHTHPGALAEIAGRLVVSPSTIRVHVGNIFTRLGVDNRLAAVPLALQRKLIS